MYQERKIMYDLMGFDFQKFKLSLFKERYRDFNGVAGGNKSSVMSDEAFFLLRDYVYNNCGIYINESKKYLIESRITNRLQINNLKSFDEYTSFLSKTNNRKELNELIDSITINETYFFRGIEQFEALTKAIIPEIIKNKSEKDKTVRIWSAACSTGEEPYSIAIMITEYLKSEYPDVNFQILASDINKTVLETARGGEYFEYSLRNTPEELLHKYFFLKDSLYYLRNDIKKMVKFSNINLYDSGQVRMVSGCDIIFCCNVLIYFDAVSRKKVLADLFDVINNNGYLFVGQSESLHGINKDFKLVHFPKAMVYKKEI
jgi:chemotaxis protein methyltransferase CheR